jgi:hypothetical protein
LTTRGAVIRGKVHGGQQPVSGATIQLYAATTGGTGLAATPLVSATVTTSDGTGNSSNSNANAGNGYNSFPVGSFTITGDYTCPTPDTQVYLAGTGGNPGQGTNTALAMMAALGSCGQLSSSTEVVINEVTTVGSVAALYPYMSSYSAMGSASTATAELANSFGLATLYMNEATGVAPGPNLPAGYYGSSTEINTLADVIASCVNTAGGTANDGSACGTLFQATKPASGAAPTDTIGALLQIMNNPMSAVNGTYPLAGTFAPFQPQLSTQPTDWTLPIMALPQTPAFSPAPGTYAAAQTVSIVSPASGETVYYTTDGSVPTTRSSVYTSPLTVSASTTLKALAVSGRAGSSGIGTAAYTIAGAAATPVISPATGTYAGPQAVTITNATPDAAIYYTVDGTTPTAASNLYVGGL